MAHITQHLKQLWLIQLHNTKCLLIKQLATLVVSKLTPSIRYMQDDLSIIWYSTMIVSDIFYCDVIVCINGCHGDNLLWWPMQLNNEVSTGYHEFTDALLWHLDKLWGLPKKDPTAIIFSRGYGPSLKILLITHRHFERAYSIKNTDVCNSSTAYYALINYTIWDFFIKQWQLFRAQCIFCCDLSGKDKIPDLPTLL